MADNGAADGGAMPPLDDNAVEEGLQQPPWFGSGNCTPARHAHWPTLETPASSLFCPRDGGVQDRVEE
jgi:hypothetical protein